MPEKRLYPWSEFLPDMYERIIPELKPRAKEFIGVWGPARGGVIGAVILSHHLDLPFLTYPRWVMRILAFVRLTRRVLIFDDIADTGKTLWPYRRSFIVTPFYHRQSIVVPNIWLHEKKDAYIDFAWEK